MKLNNSVVWDNFSNKPANHLSKQLKWLFASFDPTYAPSTLFSQNISQMHTIDKIRTYFANIDNIELGFLSATGTLTLILVVLVPILLFYFFPKICNALCCCRQKTNLISKMLEKRIFTIDDVVH